jgi:hypothetical protein
MPKIVPVSIAVVLVLAVAVAWAMATRADRHANVTDETTARAPARAAISPLELMHGTRNLPHQQFDAF